MRFASRTGELSPREGLEMAYQLFADGRLQEAAMMFLAYADQDDEIGIVGQSEFDTLTAHFKEMMAYVTIYRLLIERRLQPMLAEDGDPAYKPSPWFEEDHRPS